MGANLGTLDRLALLRGSFLLLAQSESRLFPQLGGLERLLF
jgi:hypothetical protein